MIERQNEKTKSVVEGNSVKTNGDCCGDGAVVAFLALGSIGDCLPLCALAASITASCIPQGQCPAYRFRERKIIPDVRGNEVVQDEEEQQKQQEEEGQDEEQQEEQKKAFVGVDRSCDGQRSKKQRTEHGTVNSRVLTHVITHSCHCRLLQDLMEGTFDVGGQLPRLCSVDVPILFDNRNGSSGSLSAAAQGGEKEAKRIPTTGNICAGPGDAHTPMAGQDEEDAVCNEMDACMRVLECIRPKVLIFNLFSGFGYHLADALGIPCLCASPGVPPSDSGVPLRRVLSRALMRKIDDRMQGGRAGGDEVTRADVELWMLPLFHPRYHPWRRARGLLPHVHSSGLPRAPPILFGISPAVLPRPGYWPPKAEVCGFWSFSRLSSRYQPPERLLQFLSKCEAAGKPVFVIGLGSMPELGLVQNPSRIVNMAISCLRRVGAAAVLLPTPSNPLCNCTAGGVGAQPARSAEERILPEGKQMRVVATLKGGGGDVDEDEVSVIDLAEEAFVPHKWLLPRCRGIVHHGGSGTTGAALSAGVVQVVIPLAFDQFFFADKVDYMGVGVRVHGTRLTPTCDLVSEGVSSVPEGDGVTTPDMEKAIRLALSSDLELAARRYRESVQEEDGVQTASAKISAVLASTAVAV